MNIKELDLSPLESKIISNAHNIGMTKRRIIAITVSVIVFSIILILVRTKLTPNILIVIFLVYIWITYFEKLSYGNAVIKYKGLISKLLKKLEQK